MTNKEIKTCHLASYFETNQLYSRMTENLADLGVEQLVLSPHGFKKTTLQNAKVTFQGDTIWKPFDSFWYSGKIRKYNKFLKNFPLIKEYDLCHAHSLYSDGASAYQLKKDYGIPYVITVRNTDLRIFARFFLHLRPLAREIIRESSQVLFANKQYPARLASLLNMTLDEEKVSVVPNGLDSYWFDQHVVSREESSDTIEVLSVGNVIKLKNHIVLINAVNRHNSKREALQPKMKLTIVGSLDTRYGRFLSKKYQSDSVNFTGTLPFTDIVTKMQQSDVFALLSWRENFGIAYAEAISQGLPIIYTRGEGFDGWVEDGVWGYSCKHDDENEFIRLALELNDNNPLDEAAIEKMKQLFTWENIAIDIKTIYENAVVNSKRNLPGKKI